MPEPSAIKVNTLIIGAGRSGTTSIASMLARHKDVCFSKIKEVHFFSIPDLYKRGKGYYHSFFDSFQGEPIIASADTYLMIDYLAIIRVFDYNPAMKIIIILRDPVERAYSSYNYSVNYGHHQAYTHFNDSISMEKEIENELNIVEKNNVGHFYAGRYHQHISKWLEVFKREQVLILTSDTLKKHPKLLAEELFSFLSLPVFDMAPGRENVAAIPKSKKLEKFLLDRDAPFRRMIRNLTPTFVKNMVFNSGIVDRMHEANRKAHQVNPLSEEEYKEAKKYFESDLALLSRNFGIELH